MRNVLTWPDRPRLRQTPLGRRQEWVASDGRHEIDRYPDLTGRYVAVCERRTLLGDFRSLRRAQRACEEHARRPAGRVSGIRSRGAAACRQS